MIDVIIVNIYNLLWRRSMKRKFIYSAILIVIYATCFVKTEKNIEILSPWDTVPQETIFAKSADPDLNVETHELAYIKQMEIDDTLQYLITEIKTGREYEVFINDVSSNEPKVVTIRVGDEVLLQTEMFGPSKEIMLQVIDFNFDDYVDFILLNSEGTMNSLYDWYLFDPENNEFIYLGTILSSATDVRYGYIYNLGKGGSEPEDHVFETYIITEENKLLLEKIETISPS